jgi:hypothetical protein
MLEASPQGVAKAFDAVQLLELNSKFPPPLRPIGEFLNVSARDEVLGDRVECDAHKLRIARVALYQAAVKKDINPFICIFATSGTHGIKNLCPHEPTWTQITTELARRDCDNAEPQIV